jgi:endonuclease/exonuclease/phosphatase family metal-dependent hydrolase
MTKRWRAWLTAAGILAAGLTVQSAAPAAAQSTYTFFQFNMAGNMNHAGHTELIVPAVVDSVTSSWPTAVSLNEVCRNQYNEIGWIINASGGRYGGLFVPMRAPQSNVCGGHEYGVALFIRGAEQTSFTSHPLTSTGDETRYMICGNTAIAGPRLGVCSSHLQPGGGAGAVKYTQMDEIARTALIPFAEAGLPMAFMGDTYLSPDEMRYITRGLYRNAAPGHTMTNPACEPTKWAEKLAEIYDYYEAWVNECEAGNLHRQSDYVMVSENKLVSATGGPTTTRWSDHKPVRATVVFR